MIRKTGSVKKGVVAQDLLDERAKLAFDQNEMQLYLTGGEYRVQKWKEMVDLMGNDPGLRNHLEFYEYTPHEMQEDLWKRINVLYQKHKERFFVQPTIAPPYTEWAGYF